MPHLFNSRYDGLLYLNLNFGAELLRKVNHIIFKIFRVAKAFVAQLPAAYGIVCHRRLFGDLEFSKKRVRENTFRRCRAVALVNVAWKDDGEA